MYPIAPPPLQTYHPVLPPQPPNRLQSNAVYPHSAFRPGLKCANPSQKPTTNDLKHRCRICGRFRSPAFHYRHPISGGESPAAAVCTRCRNDETDSEASSEERLDRRLRRASSQNRSMSGERAASQQQQKPRGRKLSRIRFKTRESDQDSDYHDRRYVQSISRSSSQDVGPLHLTLNDSPTQKRSSSTVEFVETVRFIQEHPLRRPEIFEEIIYVDEHRPASRQE